MGATNIDFTVFVGEEHSSMTEAAVMALSRVPPAIFQAALEKIETAETIGPLVDPTSWMGSLFDNATEWKALFRSLRDASALLHPKVKA